MIDDEFEEQLLSACCNRPMVKTWEGNPAVIQGVKFSWVCKKCGGNGEAETDEEEEECE